MTGGISMFNSDNQWESWVMTQIVLRTDRRTPPFIVKDLPGWVHCVRGPVLLSGWAGKGSWWGWRRSSSRSLCRSPSGRCSYLEINCCEMCKTHKLRSTYNIYDPPKYLLIYLLRSGKSDNCRPQDSQGSPVMTWCFILWNFWKMDFTFNL